MIKFYGRDSYLSNFYPALFTLQGKTFGNIEQYFQYTKAITFGDRIRADMILEAPRDPVKCKMLGRRVQNFDRSHWDAISYRVMLTGVHAKFSQNPKLRELLLATDNAMIAECAPRDRLWGIGLGMNNSRADDPSQWRGQNKLGQVLMEVRANLAPSSG